MAQTIGRKLPFSNIGSLPAEAAYQIRRNFESIEQLVLAGAGVGIIVAAANSTALFKALATPTYTCAGAFTDETTINAALATGRPIWLAPGSYTTSTQLIVPAGTSGVIIGLGGAAASVQGSGALLNLQGTGFVCDGGQAAIDIGQGLYIRRCGIYIAGSDTCVATSSSTNNARLYLEDCDLLINGRAVIDSSGGGAVKPTVTIINSLLNGSFGATGSKIATFTVNYAYLNNNDGELTTNTTFTNSRIVNNGLSCPYTDPIGNANFIQSPVERGLAVLVAGTVVQASALVQANSRIRLSYANRAGASGAVFVAAIVAGVSFTITSTNAGDTGTIFWEVQNG